MPPGARLDDSDDDDESEHSDDDNGRAAARRRRAARSLDRARDRSVDDDERRERQHARNESEYRDRDDRRDRGRDRDRRHDRVRRSRSDSGGEEQRRRTTNNHSRGWTSERNSGGAARGRSRNHDGNSTRPSSEVRNIHVRQGEPCVDRHGDVLGSGLMRPMDSAQQRSLTVRITSRSDSDSTVALKLEDIRHAIQSPMAGLQAVRQQQR